MANLTMLLLLQLRTATATGSLQQIDLVLVAVGMVRKNSCSLSLLDEGSSSCIRERLGLSDANDEKTDNVDEVDGRHDKDNRAAGRL